MCNTVHATLQHSTRVCANPVCVPQWSLETSGLRADEFTPLPDRLLHHHSLYPLEDPSADGGDRVRGVGGSVERRGAVGSRGAAGGAEAVQVKGTGVPVCTVERKRECQNAWWKERGCKAAQCKIKRGCKAAQ
eukprot:360675-Chlamydomonas_euryale.AAC.17